jgi:uncharacterized protein YdeI (YjbR/CyaY-like superfamily)
MDPIFFANRAEFRAWLEANHASATEVWLGHFKKASGKPSVPYAEAVEEALCFGWIDGLARSIDRDSSAQRYTPRRPRSNWSLINVKRFQELEAAGKMTPAGRAAFEARTPERTGVYSSEQGDLELPPEALSALRANEAAWAFWEKSPKSYRKPATWWVVSAKKPETREKRIAQLVECSEQGQRVPPLRPRVAAYEKRA